MTVYEAVVSRLAMLGYWSYHAAPTQRMRRGWPAEH